MYPKPRGEKVCGEVKKEARRLKEFASTLEKPKELETF